LLPASLQWLVLDVEIEGLCVGQDLGHGDVVTLELEADSGERVAEGRDGIRTDGEVGVPDGGGLSGNGAGHLFDRVEADPAAGALLALADAGELVHALSACGAHGAGVEATGSLEGCGVLGRVFIRVLTVVAQAVRESWRVFKLGGDEFIQ